MPDRPAKQTSRPPAAADRRYRPPPKPPLAVFTTTLWEYPSQHYSTWLDEDGIQHHTKAAGRTQGDKTYEGATPSWVIWQLLMRYTRRNDLIVDPMVGSGTTIDVARDLDRRVLGYDLAPRQGGARDDIFRADARKLPLEDAVADFIFVDPPYSTHITYSDDPACIGKLDAAPGSSGQAASIPYYVAMREVIAEIDRVLKPRRYMALYVSDSWRKRGKGEAGRGTGAGRGEFMPIGFELFDLLRQRFEAIDIIAVVRQNAKLKRGHWHRTAREQNYFLRGFNYLFIMKKP